MERYWKGTEMIVTIKTVSSIGSVEVSIGGLLDLRRGLQTGLDFELVASIALASASASASALALSHHDELFGNPLSLLQLANIRRVCSLPSTGKCYGERRNAKMFGTFDVGNKSTRTSTSADMKFFLATTTS